MTELSPQEIRERARRVIEKAPFNVREELNSPYPLLRFLCNTFVNVADGKLTE